MLYGQSAAGMANYYVTGILSLWQGWNTLWHEIFVAKRNFWRVEFVTMTELKQFTTCWKFCHDERGETENHNRADANWFWHGKLKSMTVVKLIVMWWEFLRWSGPWNTIFSWHCNDAVLILCAIDCSYLFHYEYMKTIAESFGISSFNGLV